MAMAVKEMMAKRAAEEIVNGNVVNLGFGIPQKVVKHIPWKERQYAPPFR